MDGAVVIGCGGIGLPLAAALAASGVRVFGVDCDRARVDALSRGQTEMSEAGLADALRAVLNNGAFSVSVLPPPAEGSRAWIIAVPTPVGADERLDERPIGSAFCTVLEHAAAGDLVIVRSTVPVGYLRGLAARAEGRGLLFAACPDRSLAGAALFDQSSIPSVIGGLDAAGAKAAQALFSRLGRTVIVSSPEAAEALKLFTNVWRDVRFGLANQFALFCSAAGLDFGEIRAAGSEGFARFDIPRAGPVGGPCLDKDVHLLAQSMAAVGVAAPMLIEARRVNLGIAGHVVDTVLAEASPDARVAVLGLAFKGAPETRDRRGSVGVLVLERLKAALGERAVTGWDPADGPVEAGAAAVRDATIVVLANDHPALADPARLAGCAPGALIYDLCGVLGPAPGLRVRRLGAEQA